MSDTRPDNGFKAVKYSEIYVFIVFTLLNASYHN